MTFSPDATPAVIFSSLIVLRTARARRAENCPQGDCDAFSCNPLPGLNDAGDGVEAFADFMTFLAPPPRGPVGVTAALGELQFVGIGCASCHVPTLVTGANAVGALNKVTFHPYSDFLLHDMGTLGDGITQNKATGRLMRTAPLWGVRYQTTLLHAGRATSLEQAITALRLPRCAPPPSVASAARGICAFGAPASGSAKGPRPDA